MNIGQLYNLFDILRDIEVALCVEASDYDERDCDNILLNVKKRLNRQYQVDFTQYKVSDALLSNSDNLLLFVETMKHLHGILSGYCQVSRYTKKIDVSLDNINYLGVTKVSMQKVLKCLQYKDTYDRAREALDSIKVKLATISICTEKRLFLLLVISDELGIYELSTCIAEILFLGTV